MQFQATEGFRGPFQNAISKRRSFYVPQSRTYTENDSAAILGIGRATAYKLANPGAFKTIRIGNMIRISRKSFEDWLKKEGLDDETE